MSTVPVLYFYCGEGRPATPFKENTMSDYAIKLTTFGHQEEKKTIPAFGTVKTNQLLTANDLEGKAVRCTNGYLWLTLQGDVMDHVLREGQLFAVPATGKVIIGGKGGFTIEPAVRMPMAS